MGLGASIGTAEGGVAFVVLVRSLVWELLHAASAAKKKKKKKKKKDGMGPYSAVPCGSKWHLTQ